MTRSSAASLSAWIAALLVVAGRDGGRLDALINNAGLISWTRSPERIPRNASGWRSQTMVGMPARRALVAIPWPIVPMPRIATGSPSLPSVSPYRLPDRWLEVPAAGEINGSVKREGSPHC